jgi:predicted alpha/beta superfamily hydrolase
MANSRWYALLVATILASVGLTLLARDIFSKEAPVAGATASRLHSVLLDEDREYYVYLPEGYEAQGTRRYPVLYVLDGNSQSGHTAESAALLARIGDIPPMIVVGVPSVDGETRNRDYTPPDMRLDTDAPGGPKGQADRFLLHLRRELIPRIERDYRTARPRMLAGWSRGALFVVYSGIRDPDLFDARFAHSPALWREDDRIIAQYRGALAAQAPDSFLYLSLGEAENPKMRAAFDRMRAMLESDPQARLRWRADLSAGGVHESNPRLSTPVGLCAMLAVGRPCRATPAPR